MLTDTIVHGETYDIEVSGQDSEGAPVPIDNTWLAQCRFTLGEIGGQITAEPTMTIANDVASASIDTGDDEWYPLVYFFDVRLTDPDGNDFWTEPIELTLQEKNTPIS
jgi:hypothetical protein